MNLLRVLVLCGCLFQVAGFALPLTITNAPLADTYFEPYGSEDKNFRSAPCLKIDQWEGRQTFLRFSLTNLPPGQRLLSATLRLYITEIGFHEQGEFPDLKTCVGLFDVVTPWTEDGLTYKSPDGEHPWNQGPGIGHPKYADVGPLPRPDLGVGLRQRTIALDPQIVTNKSWLELDLSEYVRQCARAGQHEINLCLRTSILGRNYTFCSREAAQAEQRPQLVLSLDPSLPEFSLPSVILTHWQPGQTVRQNCQLASGTRALPAGARWSFEEKPVPSRLSPTDLKPAGAQVTFMPDSPGKYRIRLAADSSTGRDATSEAADLYVLSVPAHPRLYVTPDRLVQLRKNATAGGHIPQAFLAWVTAGNSRLSAGKFHDMEAHEGTENNSLAWLITGRTEFLSNSIAYATRMLAKPMREHFRDVHEATYVGASWVHAMALHYDWCYDQLSPERRRAIAGWLKEAARWGWARSGAPVAHNDGGARQCLLGSAALALLGDDPEGDDLYRLSRENFDRNLLPWLNDGGQGGRSGDGGEYEGLHAFYIVKFAWMSQTATGEDIFSQSPFFFARLKHLLFGWYPRPLVEKHGAYSMREYYSPGGDHIRMGFVGDTQPYQSAAALCARFRDTPEAQAVRWLAGEWPTQWMQYTLRWAVLGDYENIPACAPAGTAVEARPGAGGEPGVGLAYLDRGCNTMYMRSDWSDDATWILFENAPFVSAHDGLDSGTFEIFKGDILAARTGNCDHGNIGAPHSLNYLHRTISGNCLLINDPQEKWKGFLAGAEGENDGGGERTNFPLSSSADADAYRYYREVFQRGQIRRFRTGADCAYALADLTPAYNNPRFHSGKLNRAKVTNVSRQLLYLRALDTVIVFDRVTSTDPQFKKTWLLHSLGDLDVLGGQETKQDEGEFHYTGASRAVIRYGWPKPVPSFGRCLSVTLLPEHPQFTKIGGRIELPPGKTEGFPGDQWHEQHRHHHVKDFWVNGRNIPPGNPPEARWFGEPGSEWFEPGTPDETGGRGKWRLEVSPAMPATDDAFFHVLCPRLGRDGPFPEISGIGAGLDTKEPIDYAGALVTEGNNMAAVFFARAEKRPNGFSTSLPQARRCLLVVADLAPGPYRVSVSGRQLAAVQVDENGLLIVPDAGGKVTVSP